jgi:peptidoglycan/xylan/chitin deacetylase (PgdA/CDA1 family)
MTMPAARAPLQGSDNPPSSRLGAALPSLACSALKHIASLGSMRKRLSILIYHRVLAEPDPLFPDEIDARRFEQQLGFLKANFNLISLRDAVDGLRTNSLPPRAACLTFDDGYADNATIALPLLQKHGVHATVFVATGFLGGGRMWNDTIIELIRNAPAAIDLTAAGYGAFTLDTIAQRRQAIATLLGALKYLPMQERLQRVEAIAALLPVSPRTDLMMTPAQVRQLHEAGIEIGAHTVNHPIIARLPAAAARQEIADGKHALEAMIGAPVRLFAYPNGKPGQDYQAEHVAMVKQLGFEAAVSTSWGAARPGSDLFQLPRFTPWDRDRLRFTLRMMKNLGSHGDTV